MRMIILSLLFDGSKLQRDTISKRPQYTTSIFSKTCAQSFLLYNKDQGYQLCTLRQRLDNVAFTHEKSYS